MIKHYFYRFYEKFLNKFHMYQVKKTSTGIKMLNVSSFRSLWPLRVFESKELSYRELFMGMDYLKDTYTLVDKNIKDTPHYELMECLETNGEIYKTQYIRRFYEGKLDARIPHKEYKDYTFFYKKHAEIKEQIEKGLYAPVVVYKVNNRYYIHDGKHRAALCAFLDLPVRCLLVDSFCILRQNSGVIIDMIKQDKCYSKNYSFFCNALESEEKNC